MIANMTPIRQNSGSKEASRKRQLLGNGLSKHVKAATKAGTMIEELSET
jgi:hypothetical protein